MSRVTGGNGNRFVFGEKCRRKGKLNLSWDFQITLDLMSRLDSKFVQIQLGGYHGECGEDH